MTFLRWVFVLLLCVTLPIYGSVSLAAPEHCDMQQHSRHGEMQGSSVQGVHHACCHCAHMSGKMKPGHVCQCGQHCVSDGGHLPMISHAGIQALVQTSPVIVPVFVLPSLTQDPDGFWRPPRIVV